MSWFGKKKTEADVKQLPAPERLQQFVLAMDEAAKAITTSARYMRTSNFGLADGDVPHTEYLEAIFMPAQERWKVQKVTLHEMLLPNSGVDKTSAVSSIKQEADNLRYFEALHRLAVFEQSQLTLQPVRDEKVAHHYKDIAHKDQIAFNIYGMPGRTVDGRPVGTETYGTDELALILSLHEKRIAASEAEKKEAAKKLPVKRIELPPPTLQTKLVELSEIFAAPASNSAHDTKRMATLIEMQGALHLIRRNVDLGRGVWTGGKLEGSGPYGFHRNYHESEFGKKYGDSGDDMNRWSLRGVAYAKYFRALKQAVNTSIQHDYMIRDYPDLKKIMSETAIATQSLLVMWLAQTSRQEWSGQYTLDNAASKKEVFGESAEQGNIGTLTREISQLETLISRENSCLTNEEKIAYRRSIPNLLRPMTVKEFEFPLKDLVKNLRKLERQVGDYANQNILHAIQPPEEVLALPSPEQPLIAEDVNNPQIGQLVPGKGVFIGIKNLKDKHGIAIGNYNLFAAPYDLGRDEKGRGTAIIANFNDAVKSTAKIRGLMGHNGGKYENADELHKAMRDGTYNGAWFVPPLDILEENLFENRDIGALKNTFKFSSNGIGHWYWSSTDDPKNPDLVTNVRFTSRGLDTDRKNRLAISTRPVRAELCR